MGKLFKNLEIDKRKIYFTIFASLALAAIFFGLNGFEYFGNQILPTTNTSPSLSQEIQKIEFNNKGSFNYRPENEITLNLWIPRAYLVDFPKDHKYGGHQFASLQAEIETLEPWATYRLKVPKSEYDTRAKELALRKKRTFINLDLGSKTEGVFKNSETVEQFISGQLGYSKQSEYKNIFTRFDPAGDLQTSYYLVPKNLLDDSEDVISFKCLSVSNPEHTLCRGSTVFFENVKVEYTVPQKEIENWRYWDTQARTLVASFLKS